VYGVRKARENEEEASKAVTAAWNVMAAREAVGRATAGQEVAKARKMAAKEALVREEAAATAVEEVAAVAIAEEEAVGLGKRRRCER